MRLSVCLHVYCVENRSSIQSTSRVTGVLLQTQGSAVLHFGAIWTRDMFRINKLNKLQNSASQKRCASRGQGLNAPRMHSALVIQNTQVC